MITPGTWPPRTVMAMASAPWAAAASWWADRVNPRILREAASITESR
jgi:hypothetical protein